jgi:hypothetical protein
MLRGEIGEIKLFSPAITTPSLPQPAAERCGGTSGALNVAGASRHVVGSHDSQIVDSRHNHLHPKKLRLNPIIARRRDLSGKPVSPALTGL